MIDGVKLVPRIRHVVMLNIPTEVYDRDQPDEMRAAWDAFDDIWTVKNR